MGHPSRESLPRQAQGWGGLVGGGGEQGTRESSHGAAVRLLHPKLMLLVAAVVTAFKVWGAGGW